MYEYIFFIYFTKISFCKSVVHFKYNLCWKWMLQLKAYTKESEYLVPNSLGPLQYSNMCKVADESGCGVMWCDVMRQQV